MTPFKRQMAAIKSGNVDSTIMLGIRKAVNANRHEGRYKGATSPKTTVAECGLLLEALERHKPYAGRTRTGYGARLPTGYLVQWGGRWRRVYVACYGNSGTAYIGPSKRWLATVDRVVEP